MMRYIQGESPTQNCLFPSSLDELIPEEHIARVISAYVDRLDLGLLGFAKTNDKATGRPSYDPSDLLKLYLYGYLHRIRSSRRLESECARNVEVMWLLARLTPDFKTIAEFRRVNGQAFVKVCRAFVQFCRHAQLIAGELVAIDGSKFQAVASRKKVITTEQLAKQHAFLERQIAHYLAQLDQADAEDKTETIDAVTVKEALELLQSRQQDVQNRIAFMQEQGLTQQVESEPDAKLMRTAQGMRVAYNVQTAVDNQHGLIVHHDVTQDGADNNQLAPMATATQTVLEQTTLTVTADAGYSNGEHFGLCEGNHITAYVPVNRSGNPHGDGALFDRTEFVYKQETDRYVCPAGHELRRQRRKGKVILYMANKEDCENCVLKDTCTRAQQRSISRHLHEDAFDRMGLRLQERPKMMSLRRSIVEHPFGNIKQWIFGNGRFLLKGLCGAATEMAIAVTAYNLRRAINILGVRQMMALLA